MLKYVIFEYKYSICGLIEVGCGFKDFWGLGEGNLFCYLKGVFMDVFEFSEE